MTKAKEIDEDTVLLQTVEDLSYPSENMESQTEKSDSVNIYDKAMYDQSEVIALSSEVSEHDLKSLPVPVSDYKEHPKASAARLDIDEAVSVKDSPKSAVTEVTQEPTITTVISKDLIYNDGQPVDSEEVQKLQDKYDNECDHEPSKLESKQTIIESKFINKEVTLPHWESVEIKPVTEEPVNNEKISVHDEVFEQTRIHEVILRNAQENDPIIFSEPESSMSNNNIIGMYTDASIDGKPIESEEIIEDPDTEEILDSAQTEVKHETPEDNMKMMSEDLNKLPSDLPVHLKKLPPKEEVVAYSSTLIDDEDEQVCEGDTAIMNPEEESYPAEMDSQLQDAIKPENTALEPSSRVHYQQLYSRSYLRASVLLDKAMQRNHLLALLRSEWLRLLSQLQEEEEWTMTASEEVARLLSVSADTYECNTNACKECQDLLVESVTHEAHTGHLVEMVRKVGDTITCTHLETRVKAHHQKTTGLRQEVGQLLERLEELHVHWAAYQTQMDKLQEWCGQAKASLQEIDLTPQDQEKLKEQFNQIWNLKAQFDSQSVLLNECMNHFDKSVSLVNMTDESHQRHFLSQFKAEWVELENLLQEKEQELHRIQIKVVPVPQLLAETQDTLSSVEVSLQEIDTHVTSIQQLRDISEKYKILRIKILNSKDNLDHLTQVSSAEEEQDEVLLDTLGRLSLTCQELICTIQQRITSLEYVLDNVQKTVSRVERISLTMMHLESTLQRCQKVDKEGEQIIKGAIHSCKTIQEGLARAEEDIAKVKQTMETLKKDPHHPCHLVELETQIATLQERLKSISSCIKQTHSNLKGRLDVWQSFMSSSDAVDSFLQEVEDMMESALDLPSVNRHSLKNHVEELHNLQGSMNTNEKLLDMLKTQAVQVEKTKSVETQLTRWNSVSERIESVILRYETALKLWSRFVEVQEEVRTWVESKITLIVSLQSRGITIQERSKIQ
ncbi:hypothetical protein SK128_028538, partial [Halocaridina rubra]